MGFVTACSMETTTRRTGEPNRHPIWLPTLPIMDPHLWLGSGFNLLGADAEARRGAAAAAAATHRRERRNQQAEATAVVAARQQPGQLGPGPQQQQQQPNRENTQKRPHPPLCFLAWREPLKRQSNSQGRLSESQQVKSRHQHQHRRAPVRTCGPCACPHHV
jgi:hypothetical protein